MLVWVLPGHKALIQLSHDVARIKMTLIIMKQDLTVVEIAVFIIYSHAQCDIYDFEQVRRQINLLCPCFKDT